MRQGVLAFVGDGAVDLARLGSHAHLQCVETYCGLDLWIGAEVRQSRLADGSIIVGDNFLQPGKPLRMPGDGWGDWLAFYRSASLFCAERAPLTGRPLYWARHKGGLLLASHLQLLDGFGLATQIDWGFVAHGLAYRNLRTERTGLVGVSELLPGSRLLWDGASARVEQTWSPWPFVADRDPLPLAELAPVLQHTLQAAVAAWVGARPDIMIELSGGLDSSIVAASLSAAGANCAAITFATPDADGDERYYARAVAERCAIELIEAEHDDRTVDLVRPPAHLHFRPGAYAVLGGIDQAFDDAVGDREVSVFGGIGGDNVFAFDSTVAPILDAASHFGLGRRMFRTMRDVARASNASLWDAARLSWRAWRKGPRRRWERDTTFLAGDAVPATPFVHPWDAGAETVSQAKRNHVEAIRRILDFLDRPERWFDRDVVSPLLSQPVVELCLRIPSWTWVAGGRDRAVARAAFAPHLPPEIVWRRGKGRIESLCVAAFLAQRPALRDLILGGRLAEQGLLDYTAIEAYFARDNLDGNFDYFRLLEIADAERWVRSIEASPSGRPSLDQR